MAYCDFCTCDDCQNGNDRLTHAETDSNQWICDICYCYSVCIDAKRNQPINDGPCKDKNCHHRPKLVSEFKK